MTQTGVAALNIRLQDALNPQRGGLCELKVGERVLQAAARVMQTDNDYGKDVFSSAITIHKSQSSDPLSYPVYLLLTSGRYAMYGALGAPPTSALAGDSTSYASNVLIT